VDRRDDLIPGEDEAQRNAELWRFQPRAWTPYVFDPDPEQVRKRARADVALSEVYKAWPVSTDPEVHLAALRKLEEGGVAQVFIHSARAEQIGVIDRYGRNVLQSFRGGAGPRSE
jgi:hypothetical protein